MKKINIIIAGLISTAAMAQFNINIKTSGIDVGKEAYIYTLDGSKDILYSKEKVYKDGIKLKYNKPYRGMMKAFLPDYNITIPFISENKDIEISIQSESNRLKKINYLDTANKIMDNFQNNSSKREYILPALQQIAGYYNPTDDFAVALSKEITNLTTSQNIDTSNYPFIEFYKKNSEIFGKKNAQSQQISQEEIVNFLVNSNEMLETSGLLRPALLTYLNVKESSNTEDAVAKLLASANVETSRGQTILSELIDIFNAYGMNSLKEKFLKQAEGLKCTINTRLSGTIALNKSVEIGAKLENSEFKNTINTSAKSLYDVKADKKIIVFWSSGCSHCEKELPQFIPVYQALKAKNIEIIGFSFDGDREAYTNKAKNYPWISVSELNGWYSSYAKKYNVQATPTYLVLDSQNKIIAKPDRLKDVLDFLEIK